MCAFLTGLWKVVANSFVTFTLRRGEFYLPFKMICPLISLSGFAKSQFFARLLRRVRKQSRISPSFCLACWKLYTSYVTPIAERSERSVSRRPFRNLCLHRRLETCRRSRRPLDRCFAAKGLFFACHRKFPFPWLVSRIVLAISSISGLHFHRSELRAVGSREIATMFSGGKCIGNLFRNCFGYFFGNRFGNPLRSFGVLSLCFMLDPRCQILGETARILLECTAVTKSGTGTWDGDVGRGRGTGTRRRRTGTRRRRTGIRRSRSGSRRGRTGTRRRRTRRLGEVEVGEVGRMGVGLGTRGDSGTWSTNNTWICKV